MFGRKSSEIMLEGDGLLDELCENVRGKLFTNFVRKKFESFESYFLN